MSFRVYRHECEACGQPQYCMYIVQADGWFSRLVLKLTWGRREEEPSEVGAVLGLWLKWFFEFPWLTRPFYWAAKRHHGSRQKRKAKLLAKKGYLMNDELMEQTLASRQDRNPEPIKREQRAGDDTVEVPGTQQGVKEQKEEKR